MGKKHGHHGGAWKIAYADFVTAMMALFLVLWLTSQDEKIKEAVQRSFTNPFASLTKESSGIIPKKDTPAISRDKGGNFDSAAAVELAMLRRLNEELLKALEKEIEDESEDPKPIKLDMTAEGLRISIFDRARKPIFKQQSAEFTQYGDWAMSTLAWQISLFSTFSVEVEGHTERGRKPLREDYGDWELSSDRATAARRKLIEHGVDNAQIRKVAGYADTIPIADADPSDETNRRIAIMLKVRPPNQ